MADYPKTLFKAGGDEVFWGRPCSRRIVRSEEEEAEAVQEGWQAAAPGAPPPIDPLDHDRDGRKGGSLKGAQSTRARGKRKAKP